MLKNTFDLDKNFPQASIDTIAKAKEKEVTNAFDELKDVELLKKITSETREMIPQIDERIHYWEDRRTLFLQISLGITAAALAGIVVIASESNIVFGDFFTFSTFIYIPVLILCIALVIGGIRILALWNEQNNPSYPFTKATKTWRWQYRHAETNPINTDVGNFTTKVLEEEAYKFANNLADYKIKLLKSNAHELLDQDISQLYLLLIDEKYKIKFVTKLRDSLFAILRWAMYGTGISIILLGIAFIVRFVFFK
jgi:hypothetical protein